MLSEREIVEFFHLSFVRNLAVHYLLPTAIRHKVRALVGRREVQARDVFDLSLLISRAGGDLGAFVDLLPDVKAATERIESISFGDYRAQVIAFLLPEQAAPYDSEQAWVEMQLHVISALETIPDPS